MNYILSKGIMESNIPTEKIEEIVERWEQGDYGDLSPEDVKQNCIDLDKGIIDVMGSYQIDGKKIWVWAQGTLTPTVLFPEEY